ncbi:coiled-coil domain-containing protein [Sinosporangium siamense]|uniref:ARB-07466-like C-terminal domain-containing protein n=1 Tax=Sinosporangium siamense TaxID=1367973 RepID=A0A919RR50_9ACTN|nr:hypothetical protein [Sinosporangium siamense]GII97199.1 hypothetical protein Ssi02_74300 [Sinosporangium siamense]
MADLSPTSHPHATGRTKYRGRHRAPHTPATAYVAVCASAALTLTLGTATASTATSGAPPATAQDPKPSESGLRAELKKTQERVDALIEDYNAKRVALADVRKSEEAAKRQLEQAELEYKLAEDRVARVVQLQYQAGSSGMAALIASENVDGAALLEQMAAEQTADVTGFAQARDRRRIATETAAKITERVQTEAAEIEKQREEALTLIDDIEKKLDRLVPVGSGRRANGSWAPQLPTGSDNITARTRSMRELIMRRFSLAYDVGCYRIDNYGEHPLGRACDFMLSATGSMPSAEQAALGDEIAAWTVKNGKKLGVKYVIYRQRIYNMSMPGWRSMSDRGSITENHFDHVHISMH